MNRAHNGDKGRTPRQPKQAPRSRSPTSALNDVNMPSLIQKAFGELSMFEENFYENHVYPEPDEFSDPSEQQFPGWTWKEDTKKFVKVWLG